MYPQHLSCSWLLAGSSQTNSHGEGVILSDFTLTLMTTSPSHHAPSTVDVMCSYTHAKLDIAMVITMWSQLTDSLMMGSCEQNSSVRLSIHHTFNIWEVAGKAQQAASNRPLRLEEIFRMPHGLMNLERIEFGHEYCGHLVWQSAGAVAGGDNILEIKCLSMQTVQENNQNNVFPKGE